MSSVSGAKVVALTLTSCGGGRSIPTARSTVASNAAVSAFGSRFGSARSVSVPTPAGTSAIAARRRTAARRARARRLGSPGPAEASIDRDVSRTNIASASVRTFAVLGARSAGCATASPSSTGTATSAAIVARGAPSGASREPKQRTGSRDPSLGEQEPGERQHDGQHEQAAERGQERQTGRTRQ